MECSPTPEPGYLNLPGWRCVPVYAVPLSPASRVSPADSSEPPLNALTLLPNGIPSDPRQWNRQNVYTWLEWCVDSFSLPPLDVEQFHMNGRGLCLLKKSDLRDRAPRSGDILYNALQVLLQKNDNGTVECNGTVPANISASLLQHAAQDKTSTLLHPQTSPTVWPRSISSDFHSMGHVVHENDATHLNAPQLTGSDVDSTTATSPSPSQERMTPPQEVIGPPKSNGLIDKPTEKKSEYSNTCSSVLSLPQLPQITQFGSTTNVENSVEKFNVRLLWDFLQQLLNDPQQRYNGCIIWKDKSLGVFKITDPHRLANLWGKQKNHLNMNFDKMSRALRYYYRVRILQKEPGERHCYRFLRHPNELRHCKQRSLLTKDAESVNNVECIDAESALDMSVKEEGSSPGDAD